MSIEPFEPNRPAFLTPQEVAVSLRVDVSTVRRWIGYNMLEAISLPLTGKKKKERYRVPRSAVERIVNSI